MIPLKIFKKKNNIFPNYFIYRLVEEPWQMVAPASIFFTVMLVLSGIYSIVLQNSFNEFCENLSLPFSSPIIPCGLLIDRFSIVRGSTVSPAGNFYMTLAFAWTSAMLWVVIVCVMLMRCLFGADFTLVNVSVEEYEKIVNKETKQVN